MFTKRFVDLTWRPFSTLQSFVRGPFAYTQRRPSDINLEQTNNNSNNYNNYKSEDYNQGNSNYSYRSQSLYYAAVLPLFAIMTDRISKVSCFFGGSSKLEKNRLTNRIALIQYPSNNPIEDRWAVHQLESIPGYLSMVFDGHGGWQVAEYARENLPRVLEEVLTANKQKNFANNDEYITTSIKEAFDIVENNFLEVARNAYNIGFPDTGKVGACALVTLVHGGKVYAANAGDCKGVIAKNEGGRITIRKVNRKLNANSKKEQQRLKQEFTDDDIYVCKRGEEGACYVKNRLQPTRAFGDFRLKYPEFNNPRNLGTDHGYRMKIENFKGPYISHVPEIKIFELDRNDKYLILSSDGMWDELNKNDVAQIVAKNVSDKQKLTTELLNNALGTAAKKINMTEGELRNISVGHRRRYHDDMTIIVVDLENQS